MTSVKTAECRADRNVRDKLQRILSVWYLILLIAEWLIYMVAGNSLCFNCKVKTLYRLLILKIEVADNVSILIILICDHHCLMAGKLRIRSVARKIAINKHIILIS